MTCCQNEHRVSEQQSAEPTCCHKEGHRSALTQGGNKRKKSTISASVDSDKALVRALGGSSTQSAMALQAVAACCQKEQHVSGQQSAVSTCCQQEGHGSTLTHKALALQAVGAELTPERQQAWKQWLGQYKAALKAEGQSHEQRKQTQDSANPCYIPRNHLLQKAIEQAEAGDFLEVTGFLCKPGKSQHQIV